MEYSIVATLGPGSSSKAMWEKMIKAGAAGFRLNTSHMSLPQIHEWLGELEAFLGATETRPYLVLDLQGSKWRLGDFTAFSLDPGRRIELIHAESHSRKDALPVPHEDFFEAASLSNGEIVLDDARIALALETAGQGSITARVVRGGEIVPRKGITYTSCGYRKEHLNEKDREILDQTGGRDFVRYAVSYVRDGAEMSRYRSVIGNSAYLIAKLEREPALEEATRIAFFADELWLCRGDLGAEMGVKAMAGAIHRFSGLVSGMPTPVFLAGQVFEHMTASPVPTRSEVCCLHDALIRGYQGVVLSDETALGRYPVESCLAAAMFRS